MRRTYVRRRIGAASIVGLLAWLGSTALPGALASPASGLGSRYVVAPGDTVWGIAVRSRPGEDPREVAQQIAEANGLEAYRLVPGQVLNIPDGG